MKKSNYYPVDDRVLSLYFKEIDEYPLLTREEEIGLSKRIKKGDQEALEILARSNLRFVVAVALKYQNMGLTLTDLISEGNLGLMRAAQKYDANRKVRFISYAVWWIRQAILQAISEQTKVFRVPLNKAGAMQKIGKVSSDLAQRLGREPTEEEIACYVNLDTKEIRKLLNISRPPASLDQPFRHTDDNVLQEYLKDESELSPEDLAYERIRSEIIETILQTLSEREAFIIRNYFGLEEKERMTLEQIGKELGITRERVRQIKERALERLHHVPRSRSLAAFLN
jgi:RNA polymerase primary sigma factor